MAPPAVQFNLIEFELLGKYPRRERETLVLHETYALYGVIDVIACTMDMAEGHHSWKYLFAGANIFGDQLHVQRPTSLARPKKVIPFDQSCEGTWAVESRAPRLASVRIRVIEIMSGLYHRAVPRPIWSLPVQQSIDCRSSRISARLLQMSFRTTLIVAGGKK